MRHARRNVDAGALLGVKDLVTELEFAAAVDHVADAELLGNLLQHRVVEPRQRRRPVVGDNAPGAGRARHQAAESEPGGRMGVGAFERLCHAWFFACGC